MRSSVFVIAILVLVGVTQAAEQPQQQFFVDNDGESVVVESRNTADSNRVFPIVVAAIEQAGYRRAETSDNYIEPGMKTDTWCRVDVYMSRQILVECYTPHQGHGVSISDQITTRTEDYSGVAPMIARIRNEHRQVSVAIDIKS